MSFNIVSKSQSEAVAMQFTSSKRQSGSSLLSSRNLRSVEESSRNSGDEL